MQFGITLGHGIRSAMFNFLTGCLVFLPFFIALPEGTEALRGMKKAPFYLYFAGPLGAIYVVGSILITPKIGLSLFFVMLVFGQLVVAMLFDHFGWMGFPVNRFGWLKLVGGALVIVGTIMLQVLGTDQSNDAAVHELIIYCLCAIIAGAALPLQASLNKSMRDYVKGTVRSSWLSFTGGMIVLLVASAITISFTPLQFEDFAWWSCLGGLIGVLYIGMSIVIPRFISLAAFFVFMVLGQLGCSLWFDAVGAFGYTKQPVNVMRALGVTVAFVGCLLVTTSRKPPGRMLSPSVSHVALASLVNGANSPRSTTAAHATRDSMDDVTASASLIARTEHSSSYATLPGEESEPSPRTPNPSVVVELATTSSNSVSSPAKSNTVARSNSDSRKRRLEAVPENTELSNTSHTMQTRSRSSSVDSDGERLERDDRSEDGRAMSKILVHSSAPILIASPADVGCDSEAELHAVGVTSDDDAEVETWTHAVAAHAQAAAAADAGNDSLHDIVKFLPRASSPVLPVKFRPKRVELAPATAASSTSGANVTSVASGSAARNRPTDGESEESEDALVVASPEKRAAAAAAFKQLVVSLPSTSSATASSTASSLEPPAPSSHVRVLDMNSGATGTPRSSVLSSVQLAYNIIDESENA